MSFVDLGGLNAEEAAVARFSVALYRYCHAVGGSVTSWFRTVKHNADVQGVAGSRHLHGLAADVVPDDLTWRLEPDVRAAFARGFGLKLVVEGTHDHLQSR